MILAKKIPWLLFFFVLPFYLHNLSRSVYGGDVGDLVTSAYVVGVPHPPGYPLFTFLGFLLTRLGDFLSQPPAFMVGLISVFSGVGAVVLFYLISQKFINSKLVSVVSSLTVAFSYLFWFYVEIAEVFALNNFFALLLIYLALLFREKQKNALLYLLAFFAGLSLTNHHTILFIFPSLLILIARPFFNLIKVNKSVIIKAFLFGLLGFSVYFYAVFASLQNPVIDWANINDIRSFIALVLRERYGTFQAGVFVEATLWERIVILRVYAMTLFTQVTLPVTFLCFLGIIVLFKKNQTVFFAFISAFLLTGPIFMIYAGFPLLNKFYFGMSERFLSLSSIIFILFMPFGLYAFTKWLASFFRNPSVVVLLQAVFFLIPIQLFLFNFPKTNLSQTFIGDELGRDFLRVLPEKSILIMGGDTALFNTWYVYYALHFRPDTVLLNGADPMSAMEGLEKEFPEVKKIFATEKDSALRFIKVIAFLDAKHPVYSYQQFVIPGEKAVEWVPYGLVFELRRQDEDGLSKSEFAKRTKEIFMKMKVPTVDNTSLATGSLTVADIPYIYTSALVQHGNYARDTYNDIELAENYYQEALAVTDDYSKTYIALGSLYLNDKSQCGKASDYFQKAIEVDPTDKRYYYIAYVNLSECPDYENKKEDLASLYSQTFFSSLQKDLQEYSNSRE